MILIETIVDSSRWTEALPNVDALVGRVHAAAAELAAETNGPAALLLTGDAALAELNARFRGVEGPTNVLSFPSGAAAPAFLGDIAIAFETCAREAAEQGRPIENHLSHLIVHGLLHLVGYDHVEDEAAAQMERLEARILGRLGVPDPYLPS
jgi:probable rRNA maturation factor